MLQRGGKIFVRDFDSTNGTFVNDNQVTGESEVKHERSRLNVRQTFARIDGPQEHHHENADLRRRAQADFLPRGPSSEPHVSPE